jgi:hypothetical protein
LVSFAKIPLRFATKYPFPASYNQQFYFLAIMKKTFLLIALGAAFLAASLWVWLSNGKSAKAVKAKFRLGGAILTITGMMAAGSCSSNSSQISCYDPAPSNEVYVDRQGGYDNAQDVKNGDEINIRVKYFSAYGIRVAIETPEQSTVLQNVIYEITESRAEITHTIDVADYLGEAYLRVYIMFSADEEYKCDNLKLNVIE